jgi:hypothetical protein
MHTGATTHIWLDAPGLTLPRNILQPEGSCPSGPSARQSVLSAKPLRVFTELQLNKGWPITDEQSAAAAWKPRHR